MVTPE